MLYSITVRTERGYTWDVLCAWHIVITPKILAVITIVIVIVIIAIQKHVSIRT